MKQSSKDNDVILLLKDLTLVVASRLTSTCGGDTTKFKVTAWRKTQSALRAETYSTNELPQLRNKLCTVFIDPAACVLAAVVLRAATHIKRIVKFYLKNTFPFDPKMRKVCDRRELVKYIMQRK